MFVNGSEHFAGNRDLGRRRWRGGHVRESTRLRWGTGAAGSTLPGSPRFEQSRSSARSAPRPAWRGPCQPWRRPADVARMEGMGAHRVAGVRRRSARPHLHFRLRRPDLATKGFGLGGCVGARTEEERVRLAWKASPPARLRTARSGSPPPCPYVCQVWEGLTAAGRRRRPRPPATPHGGTRPDDLGRGAVAREEEHGEPAAAHEGGRPPDTAAFRPADEATKGTREKLNWEAKARKRRWRRV